MQATMETPTRSPQPAPTRRETLPTGPAAAAFLAAGIGTCAYGLITFIAQVARPFGQAITVYPPAGPLTGKTTLYVVIWLVAWGILHYLWRGKDVNIRTTFIATLALMAVGLLFMFPPVFEAFGG
jgi:hypothetical protein